MNDEQLEVKSDQFKALRKQVVIAQIAGRIFSSVIDGECGPIRQWKPDFRKQWIEDAVEYATKIYEEAGKEPAQSKGSNQDDLFNSPF